MQGAGIRVDERFARRGTGSHEEGPQSVLVSGDRTLCVGEGDLKMSEDFRSRLMGRVGQSRWRTPSSQRRADPALGQLEPFPDSLQRPVTEMAVGNADRGRDPAADRVFEEFPQGMCGQAQPSDFVGQPDAEGPPATRTPVAIAAKDPPCPNRSSPGTTLIKTGQRAMPNQRPHHLAVRAWCQFESLGNGDPFLRIAIKPTLLTHLLLIFDKNHGSNPRKKRGERGMIKMEARGAGQSSAVLHSTAPRCFPNCQCNQDSLIR